MAAATGWSLREQRATTIEHAGIDLKNLSIAVADQVDRVLRSVELAEDRLLDHLVPGHDGATGDPVGLDSSLALHVLLRDMIAGMSEAYGLVLIDQNGKLLNQSHRFPITERSLADRSYFQFARAHPEVRTFISEPLINRETGRTNFYVVRRLTRPDGTFNGLLLGSIEVEYVQHLFSASILDEGGSISLFRPDGTMLVRSPPVPLEATRGREAEFRASFFAADRGPIRRRGVFDGLERLTAITSLPRHPMIIAVSAPVAAILAPWRREAWRIGGLSGLGCLAIVATTLLAVRRSRDQRRVEAAAIALRLHEERDQQYACFGTALDTMNQGLLMFDAENRLLLANASAGALFALGPGTLRPGMTIMDIIDIIGATGRLSAPPGVVAEIYLRLVWENVPVNFIRKLPDGRHMAISFAPNESGWVITFEDVTKIRTADERIAHMALHDALTGLPNRALLRTFIEDALATVPQGGRFAVLCLDLDRFKDVNDTLGHSAGDKLLCAVAARIRSAIRPSDVVARLGGDEFAIIVAMADGTDGDVAGVASRLVETLGAPYDIDGHAVFVGGSVGVSCAPADGVDPEALMKNADLALYRAKAAGRGRYVFFEPAMEQALIERRRIEHDLHEALAAGQFIVYYQPQVRISSRRVVGFEALLRWRHPTRGMIPPTEFIPVAEDNGAIVQLGAWALRQACEDAARWPDGLKVAVNLSPVQFRSLDLVEMVGAALADSGLDPRRLELEITESTVMHDPEMTLATIGGLKALGVRIAMDDFGTGYSSLAYLQKFPFDKVKIDRAFVRDSDQATNFAIIRAVTWIAASLGIETTAEGVETEAQFATVASVHCGEAQGYLFSPALPNDEVPAIVARLAGQYSDAD